MLPSTIIIYIWCLLEKNKLGKGYIIAATILIELYQNELNDMPYMQNNFIHTILCACVLLRFH